MKCPNCGSDSSDNAGFCEKCGMSLEKKACPHCGANLTDCEPVVKTTVKSSGGGYGCLSGCLGIILLGPLGLLCGLKEKNVTSSNQTWWACKRCGNDFVEKEAAKKLIDSVVMNTATTTLIIGLIWQFIYQCIGYNHWVRDISLLLIVGSWFGVPEAVKASTGCTLKQLLGSQERMDFYKKCVLYCAVAFFLGAGVGGKIMQLLFS